MIQLLKAGGEKCNLKMYQMRFANGNKEASLVPLHKALKRWL